MLSSENSKSNTPYANLPQQTYVNNCTNAQTNLYNAPQYVSNSPNLKPFENSSSLSSLGNSQYNRPFYQPPSQPPTYRFPTNNLPNNPSVHQVNALPPSARFVDLNNRFSYSNF